MSSTFEYHSEIVECPECGTKCSVEVTTDYDTQEDNDFSVEITGYQMCDKCNHRFINEDLSD
jgi:hypothetical protein